MELSPQEKSSAWWSGAIGGAFKGVPMGLVVALGAAALLAFVAIPMVPALAPIVGSFLSFPGAPALLTIPVLGTAFFPIPLLFFNTAITIASNAMTYGDAAVQTARQEKYNLMCDARIAAIEHKLGVAPEQEPEPITRSQNVSKILAQGTRPQGSHVEAEQLRDAQSPSRSVH